MQTYLDRILDSTRVRVAEAKRHRPPSGVERDAAEADPPRGFAAAIRAPGMSLIAEIKRRSPSKGEIRSGIDPAQVAAAYERGGARCLSVLTEPDHFSGCLQDLARARAATALPALRKDFVVDAFQVAEARAGGADAILLIVAALPDPGLFADLAATAAGYGMAALIEVHDEWELEAASAVGPELIGVNQRDLRTFAVDAGLARRLRPQVPAHIPMVAESGIVSRGDVEALEGAGIEAMLVGETLMRADDPAAATAMLLGR